MPQPTRADSPTKICAIEDCGKPLRARGLCASHYNKQHHADRSHAYDPVKKKASDYNWSHRRRLLIRTAKVEAVNRTAVAERDGWVCHLCGESIDKTLAWPDCWSVSLDHLTPLSKGGEHSYANTKAAHLTCNRRRGTSPLPARGVGMTP